MNCEACESRPKRPILMMDGSLTLDQYCKECNDDMKRMHDGRFYWLDGNVPGSDVLEELYESPKFSELMRRFFTEHTMSVQELGYELQNLAEGIEERLAEQRKIAAYEDRMTGSED